MRHKLITKHQWLVHSLYGQKYWHPFFRRDKYTYKLHVLNVLHLCCNSFEVYEMTESHIYKSLVFGDEFLSQGLHLKSHQRCSAGIRPVKFFHTDWIIISLWFLSYTQRHCHVRIEKSPNCCYKIRFPRISLYASTLRFVLMEITKIVKPLVMGWPNTFVHIVYFLYWHTTVNNINNGLKPTFSRWKYWCSNHFGHRCIFPSKIWHNSERTSVKNKAIKTVWCDPVISAWSHSVQVTWRSLCFSCTEVLMLC